MQHTVFCKIEIAYIADRMIFNKPCELARQSAQQIKLTLA